MKKIILALLMLALACCAASCDVRTGAYESYDMTGYAVYTEAIAPEGITSVELDWVNGEVFFERGETFTVTETADSEAYLPLYYKTEGSKLILRYCKSGLVAKKLADLK